VKRPGLYVQVLVAVALGVAFGVTSPETAVLLRPLGEGFVQLVKMLIAPIVFATVVTGIAGMGDLKRVGRVGAKAVLYFEVMTTLALLLGGAMMHLVRPGAGMHVDVTKLDAKSLEQTMSGKGAGGGFVQHVLAVIPESFVGAFANGDVLQVLVLAILCGLGIAGLGVRGRPLMMGLSEVSKGLFAVVGLVMKLAPIGAFGAMAFTIGKFGLGTLGSLAKLMATFYGTSLLFVLVVLGAVMRALGLSILGLARYLREELVIVLGTSSSESALPRLMSKLEDLGCSSAIVRLVVPTGYSFNLDGTCIYLTLASLFVAQALDVPLALGDELLLLGVLLLTSKGAAGVTGSGFVTLAATLASTGKVPVTGLVLLLGIDRFMSEARALTNFVGNAVATLVVARWEGEIDLVRARALLARGAASELQRRAGEGLDPREEHNHAGEGDARAREESEVRGQSAEHPGG
jgi:aerobic C4-dicarboxylate transport protein